MGFRFRGLGRLRCPRSRRGQCGRGMFGAECVGVSLARGERLTVAASGASLDVLGMGTIAYWRSHPWFPAADEVEETSDMGGAS